MSEADQILALARTKADERLVARVPINGDALNKMVKRQRATLTRAINSKSQAAVVIACRDAVREWNRPGLCWPDDWSRWQRALDDILPFGQNVQLEDL